MRRRRAGLQEGRGPADDPVDEHAGAVEQRRHGPEVEAVKSSGGVRPDGTLVCYAAAMDSGTRPTRLRILFLSSIPRWGGGERWMLDAAAGLAARGHAVVLAARPGATLLDRARDVGLPHRAVRMGGDFDPRAIWRVRGLLKEHAPHAVFVNLDKELRYVCLATLAGKRPLVFQRRGSDDALKTGSLQRWSYTRCATRILTNSETLARTRLRVPDWMPHDHVRVLPNGVPVRDDDGAPDRSTIRRNLRLPRRQRLVVHLGELHARKGQETTLAALAKLRARAPGPKPERNTPVVAFVGTGPDEAVLRDRCHALGVQRNVLWVGFRTNAEEYLAAADLCVLPSRAEGAPWTLLEAMAQGTPVVASAVSGVPEIVTHEVNGLLVAPDDVDGLAAAMQRVLDDEALAERLVAAGRQHVRQLWNAGAMLDDIESLVYAELLRQRASGQAAAHDVTPRGASAQRDAPQTPNPPQTPHAAAARAASGAALFADRDGTLVHNVPYNGDPAAVELVPGAARALRWVRDAGIPVIVITNQSGVAQGLHSEADVHAVHVRTRELLREQHADLDALYYCPHHPDHGPPCDCRKPAPGLLVRAMQEHGLAAQDCLMVGDAQRDLDAARAAGVPAVGLSTLVPEDTFADGESVYAQWTAIVRDFLRARYGGGAFEPRAALRPGAASVPSAARTADRPRTGGQPMAYRAAEQPRQDGTSAQLPSVSRDAAIRRDESPHDESSPTC